MPIIRETIKLFIFLYTVGQKICASFLAKYFDKICDVFHIGRKSLVNKLKTLFGRDGGRVKKRYILLIFGKNFKDAFKLLINFLRKPFILRKRE